MEKKIIFLLLFAVLLFGCTSISKNGLIWHQKDREGFANIGIKMIANPSDFQGVGRIIDSGNLINQGFEDVRLGDLVGIRCQDDGCFRIQLEMFRTRESRNLTPEEGK